MNAHERRHAVGWGSRPTMVHHHSGMGERAPCMHLVWCGKNARPCIVTVHPMLMMCGCSDLLLLQAPAGVRCVLPTTERQGACFNDLGWSSPTCLCAWTKTCWANLQPLAPSTIYHPQQPSLRARIACKPRLLDANGLHCPLAAPLAGYTAQQQALSLADGCTGRWFS